MTRRPPVTHPLVVGLCALSLCACLEGWSPAGPYRCPELGCTDGLVCDDGICCKPGGVPACRTRPFEGVCSNGDVPKPYFVDGDDDGVGDSAKQELRCARPLRDTVRWVEVGGDCDDARPTVKPGLPEACNGRDDDCDGRVDWTPDGRNRITAWFRDADADGYGNSSQSVELCISLDAGYAPVGGDCRDDDPQIHPGRLERCNGADDNCNARTDEAPLEDTFVLGYHPTDFAACSAGQGQCLEGNRVCRGGVPTCEPRRAAVTDVCNGLDDDCDGQLDEQPGCGGPAQLTKTPGTVAVRLVALPSATIGGCLLHVLSAADAGVSTWASPQWNLSTPVHPSSNDGAGLFLAQLWTFTAPPGEVWDLSRARALDLGFLVQPIINYEDAAGTNLPLPFWGDAARFPQPVVQFCAEDGRRLFHAQRTQVDLPVPIEPDDGGPQPPAQEFRVQLDLGGASAGWSGGWTDSSRTVRRIELLVSHHTSVTGTVRGGEFVTTGLRFLPTTGFVR